MSDQATIRPGAFIVLEGVDGSGKSTILNKFRVGADRGMFSHPLLTTHQPSGSNPVGEAVYALTEAAEILSPWARQFLHLASHSEHYEREIGPAMDADTPIIMDRCWWSTIAYGWFAGNIREESPLEYDVFESIVQLPTLGYSPDLVFLFMEPHVEDYHNTPELMEGYEFLFNRFGRHTVKVPMGTEDEQFAFVLTTLADRGLAA